MLGAVALSFLVGFFKEISSNPLELPGWAQFFGLMLMIIPPLFAFLGMCIPKSKMLCCCFKHIAKDPKGV
jgi:hypothetical protein